MSSGVRSILDPSTPSSSSPASLPHHLRPHHRHPGGGGGSAAAAATAAAREEGNARLSQLLDESDHKRCSDGNRDALLAEALDRLRALAKEIEEDSWMYRDGDDGGAGSGGVGVGSGWTGDYGGGTA